MSRLRKAGGERAEKGTYWNFQTGEKVVMEKGGILPGPSSERYYKLPPLVILGFWGAAAFAALLIIPEYAKSLYAGYADRLVFYYAVSDYLAVGIVLTLLSIIAARDVFFRVMSVTTFEWSPLRAYFAGKKRDKKKAEKKR
jgi:hypothetical protein